MLVIMTGGIDLSVPGTFTLAAVVTVGVAQGADDRTLARDRRRARPGSPGGVGQRDPHRGTRAQRAHRHAGGRSDRDRHRDPLLHERRDPDAGPREALRVDVGAVPRGDADVLGGGGLHGRPDRHLPVHHAGPQVPGGRRQPHRVADRRPAGQPEPDVGLRASRRSSTASRGSCWRRVLRTVSITIGAPYLLGRSPPSSSAARRSPGGWPARCRRGPRRSSWRGSTR